MKELPLFPLHAVLFPGGELRLRVFEPRYLSMVRDCTAGNRVFGVCQIADGHEVGVPATPASFGTTAQIVDFNVDPQGILGIVVEGVQRFHVKQVRIRDTGMVVADVDLFEDEPSTLRAEHSLLASLLDKILEQAGGKHAKAPARLFDSACWVGYRLAELLPLDNDQRQGLLQCACPHQRLSMLLQWVPKLTRE
ncbi:LON peptidase substrate-binding domain-containing protein [Pseudomarimonas arenosa]|uniref:LON peptidase substrate-binding domain-containing protein n=1 Tax=Pseudomarimonas arenosa TaxID=2774145 RepID=A0AAW3ZJA8_9GAMM|nr:LON peptidase substrate-binding domain-containing protein [Pseudomarimonas arenosa]MBD8525107.1 LON peptidase substrate-binding domain-containing protein [Pseudomarimonas arenosa]